MKIVQIGKLISYCHILSEIAGLDRCFKSKGKMHETTYCLISALTSFWIIAHKALTPYPHYLA